MEEPRFESTDVKNLRDKLDMTQQQFADAIGCGKRVVAGWESGKRVRMQRALRINCIKLQKKADKS